MTSFVVGDYYQLNFWLTSASSTFDSHQILALIVLTFHPIIQLD